MSKLIHIIGTSCAGKGTLHPQLNGWLNSEGYNVESIQEPGPLRIYTKAYREKTDKNAETELALFTADRFITYTERVFPKLSEKYTAFTFDRGLPDTIVYQGIIGGIDIDRIFKMNSIIPESDVYLCLIVDGDVGYKRALERQSKGGEKISKSETPEQINKLASAYKTLDKYFKNVKIIDTSKMDEQQVFEECRKHTYQIL